jgi:hypothetical protein
MYNKGKGENNYMKNVKVPDPIHARLKALAKKRKMKIEGLAEVLLDRALKLETMESK